MKLLFVKGNKGLAANHNGKFYFPNRDSNIKEGLYECETTLDKEKYAFVTGVPVTTHMPTTKLLSSVVVDTDGTFNRVVKSDIRKIGESLIFYIQRNWHMFDLGYVNGSGKLEKIESYSYNERRPSNVYTLYDSAISKAEICMDNKTINLQIISEIACEIDDEMAMEIAAVAKSRQGIYANISSIKVVQRKFVVIATKLFSHHTFFLAYAYNPNTRNVIEINEFNTDVLMQTEYIKEIDLKQLDEFFIKNHLALHCQKKYSDDQIVFEVKTNFMGDTVSVKCLDANIMLRDIDDSAKKEVKNSFKDFELYRKKAGKYVSKSNIEEFKKLSTRSILGLD